MMAQDWYWLRSKTYCLLKAGEKVLCVCVYIYIYTFHIKTRAAHNFTSTSLEKGCLTKRRRTG